MANIKAQARRFAVWRELQDVRGRTIKAMAGEVGIHPDTFHDIAKRAGWTIPRVFDTREEEADPNLVPVDEVLGDEPRRSSLAWDLDADRKRERAFLFNTPHLGHPRRGRVQLSENLR